MNVQTKSALAVGAGGLLVLGALWWKKRAEASQIKPAVKQSLLDALRQGGAAGCQAAAMAYKVPPQVSGPLCGLGALAAVAGLKALGKAAPAIGKAALKGGKGVYKLYNNPVGKIVAAPVTIGIAAAKGLGKLLHLGDLGDDDLAAYALAGPARGRQRVRGGLRSPGAAGCSGSCGCAPCGGGGGGRKPYFNAQRRTQKGKGREQARGRAFYLAALS